MFPSIAGAFASKNATLRSVNFGQRVFLHQKLINQAVTLTASSFLVSKRSFLVRTFGEPIPRPFPYDYKNKRYGMYAKLFDKTIWRFDSNSKIILVEGNLACGKTEVAKKIAHDFGLKYIPSPTCEDIFILPNGFDKRDLNHRLPRHLKHYDFEMFYTDSKPKLGLIGLLQFYMFQQRILHFAEAMLHMYSTGQGIVMERSPHGDIIFPYTLKKLGYMSEAALKYYLPHYKNNLGEFMPPHLVIYLDAPVNVVREGLKKRDIPYEVNSPVLSDKYLEAYNYYAKDIFLPRMERTGETLVVDVSDGVHLDDIVEDVSKIDLETKDHDHFTKFDMWAFTSEHELSFFRHKADDVRELTFMSSVPALWDASELVYTPEDTDIYRKAVYEHPMVKYATGYEDQSVPLLKRMFSR